MVQKARFNLQQYSCPKVCLEIGSVLSCTEKKEQMSAIHQQKIVLNPVDVCKILHEIALTL